MLKEQHQSMCPTLWQTSVEAHHLKLMDVSLANREPMAVAISTGVAQLESPQRVVLVTFPAQDIIMIYCCETSMSHKCETQDTWVVCVSHFASEMCLTSQVRPRHVSACLSHGWKCLRHVLPDC
jgi:hypothetical protein